VCGRPLYEGAGSKTLRGLSFPIALASSQLKWTEEEEVPTIQTVEF
jgi:hypothetical protein